MPSSTSNSELASGADHVPARSTSIDRRHLILILAVLALCAAGIEAGVRFGFARISRIERRIRTEHTAALNLRRSSSETPVLLAGDSLLLMDVDLNVLPRTLHAKVSLQRFSVEQTTYLDWLFGLRRLFSDGARPAVVVLCLAPFNLTTASIRGDYSAFYLFKPDDIADISKRINYDLTKQSSLLFAHYSLFFAGRSNLRNFVLSTVFPAYAHTLHDLETHGPPPLSDEEFLRVCRPRFRELEELCESYGAHLAYVIPPGFGIPERAIVQAGSQAGAAVLVPVHSDAWPQSKFLDGFHLSESSANEFTEKLGPSLDALLASF